MDRASFVERYEQSWHRLLDLRTAAGEPRDAAAHDLARAWARAWNQHRDLAAGAVEDDVLDEAARLAHRRREGDPVAASTGRPTFERIVALGAPGRRRTRRLQLVAGAAALALAAGIGVVGWRASRPGSTSSESPSVTSTPIPPPIVVPDLPGDPGQCSPDAPQQWAGLVTRAQNAAVTGEQLLRSTFTDVVLAEGEEGLLLADVSMLPGRELYQRSGLQARVTWRPRGGEPVVVARWLGGMPHSATVRNGRVAFSDDEEGGLSILRWFDVADPLGTLQQREQANRWVTFSLLDDALFYTTTADKAPYDLQLRRIDLPTGQEETVVEGISEAADTMTEDHFAWIPTAELDAGAEVIPHLMSLAPGAGTGTTLRPVANGELHAGDGWLIGRTADHTGWAVRPDDGTVRIFPGAIIDVLPGDQALGIDTGDTTVVRQLLSGTSAPIPEVNGVQTLWGMVTLMFAPAGGAEPRYALIPLDRLPRLC